MPFSTGPQDGRRSPLSTFREGPGAKEEHPNDFHVGFVLGIRIHKFLLQELQILQTKIQLLDHQLTELPFPL